MLVLTYGALSYIVFLMTFLYAIGFVGNVIVPKSIDSGAIASSTEALLINVALLGIFALQHSIMARQGFKRWWTKVVPEPVERSTYVLFSSAALILLFWQWRPLPGTAWAVASPILADLLWAVFGLGWAIVLISTCLISHFDLFGLRQVWTHAQGTKYESPAFTTPLFYRSVRHPLYFGFLLAFWATPVMSWGHLLFAVASTGYIVIGALLEERDLRAIHGQAYSDYQKRVPMLFPRLSRKE